MVNDVNANKVIEKIIKRGIGWFDLETLSLAQRKQHYGNAQSILRNETFKNEFNHLVADFVQEIARKSASFDNVLLLRAGINVLEAFRERLEAIPDPENITNQTDLTSAL